MGLWLERNLPKDFDKNLGAMMGGFGSGGHNRTGRSTTAETRSIDVNRLNREGCLVPGWRGNWQWTRDGQRVSFIGMETEDGAVTLVYRWRRGESPWQDVREQVPVVWTPCRYGGRRPYFVCPGVVNGRPCGRTVVKLYADGAYYLCRHCYRLTYPCQRERTLDRTIRRADRIRMKLGGEPGMLNPFPPKPKGMHWATYDRLYDEGRAAAATANRLFMERLGEIESKFLCDDLHMEPRAQRRASRKEFWA